MAKVFDDFSHIKPECATSNEASNRYYATQSAKKKLNEKIEKLKKDGDVLEFIKPDFYEEEIRADLGYYKIAEYEPYKGFDQHFVKHDYKTGYSGKLNTYTGKVTLHETTESERVLESYPVVLSAEEFKFIKVVKKGTTDTVREKEREFYKHSNDFYGLKKGKKQYAPNAFLLFLYNLLIFFIGIAVLPYYALIPVKYNDTLTAGMITFTFFEALLYGDDYRNFMLKFSMWEYILFAIISICILIAFRISEYIKRYYEEKETIPSKRHLLVSLIGIYGQAVLLLVYFVLRYIPFISGCIVLALNFGRLAYAGISIGYAFLSLFRILTNQPYKAIRKVTGRRMLFFLDGGFKKTTKLIAEIKTYTYTPVKRIRTATTEKK